MSMARKCGWCRAADKQLFRCAKCCLVSYCGRDCQLKHWKSEHKASCRKTQLKITFSVVGENAPQIVGDSSPENISMGLFVKMTAAEKEEAVVKFSNATRSVRKYKDEMIDVSLRWAAVSATTRLALMKMVMNDWEGADTQVRAFFRLVERLEQIHPSQAQRDEWRLDNSVVSMTKNRCVVQEVLLKADIFVTQKRVWDLEPGKHKSEQTYALVQRIMLSQRHYVKLGPEYVEMNVYCRIQMVDMCMTFLVDLGCKHEDVENGVELYKSFGMLDNQLALGFAIFDSAVKFYPERAEQFAKLKRLVGVVKTMKDYVVHGDFGELGDFAEFVEIHFQAFDLASERLDAASDPRND